MFFYLSLIDSAEDRSKFEIIYTNYKDLMFYVADQILQNRHDAEDAVHQAFLSVISILERIEDPSCPKTRSLVVIIVERKAIDIYRKRRHVASGEWDENTLPYSVASTSEQVTHSMGLAAAIAVLPPRDREILLLKYDEGFSDREIAKLLEMKDDAVRKAIQRAKERLQNELAKQGITI